MKVADAFLNVNLGISSHLWIVIAETPTEYAIVNMTTRRPPCDEACVIIKGEHPFVFHDTIVEYRRGQMVEHAVLKSAQDHGYLEMRDPVSAALLARIQQGALVSDYTPQKIQEAVASLLNP